MQQFQIIFKNEKIRLYNLLSFCFAFKYYFRKKKYAFGHTPFFFLLMLAWINLELYVPAFIALVLELLSYYSLQKPVIVFTKDRISYPSFPRKKIAWSQLNNAILKDGILTIDLKNNKLIQQFIDEKNSAIDEKEFNDFCRQQLQTTRISV